MIIKIFSINYNDISLLIKLSKTHFDLTELVYTGSNLLKYRRNPAKQDIENIFSYINLAIDNTLNEFENRNENKFDFSFPSNHENLFYSYNLNVRNIENYFGNTILKPVADVQYLYLWADRNHTLNNGIHTLSVCPYIGNHINNLYIDFGSILNYGKGFFTNNIESFNTKINELVKIKFMTEHGDKFTKNTTQTKTLVTGWIITLKAHIKARENL